jgi:hypothetical protein
VIARAVLATACRARASPSVHDQPEAQRLRVHGDVAASLVQPQPAQQVHREAGQQLLREPQARSHPMHHTILLLTKLSESYDEISKSVFLC